VSNTRKDFGADRALVASDQAPAGLGPSGFDHGYWTLAQAVEVCRQVEAICPAFGCHVALTGGTLYKDGARKDLDLLFYRIRQVDEIDQDGLFAALATIGIEQERGFGWCFKATMNGKKIDCFFPEEQGGEYVRIDEADEIPFDIGEAA
jgi:hypothetical protein